MLSLSIYFSTGFVLALIFMLSPYGFYYIEQHCRDFQLGKKKAMLIGASIITIFWLPFIVLALFEGVRDD